MICARLVTNSQTFWTILADHSWSICGTPWWGQMLQQVKEEGKDGLSLKQLTFKPTGGFNKSNGLKMMWILQYLCCFYLNTLPLINELNIDYNKSKLKDHLTLMSNARIWLLRWQMRSRTFGWGSFSFFKPLLAANGVELFSLRR